MQRLLLQLLVTATLLCWHQVIAHSDAQYSGTFITIALRDTSTLEALEFANSREYLDPSAEPLHLLNGVFEFRSMADIPIDSAINALRTEGHLVNPVVEGGETPRKRYSDRVIVEFSPNLNASERITIIDTAGCLTDDSCKWFTGIYYLRVTEARGRSTLDVAAELRQAPSVLNAYPEAIVEIRLNELGDGDYRHLQWPMDNRGQSGGTAGADIDALHAWRVTTGSDSVLVAVLDGSFSAGYVNPIRYDLFDHEDAADSVSPIWIVDESLDGWNGKLQFCHETTVPWERAFCAHGTSVLGVMAAAHNELGIDGIAPTCQYIGLKIYGEWSQQQQHGLFLVDAYPYSALMRAAFDWNIKIIVNSWDIYSSEREDFPLTFRALDTIRNYAHAAIFWAAGNDGGDVAENSPFAADSNVFTIGATDHYDSVWAYSNYGGVAMTDGNDIA